MIPGELEFLRECAEKHYRGGAALDVGSAGDAFRGRAKFPYTLKDMFEQYITFDRRAEAGVDVVGDAQYLSEYIAPKSISFLICTSLLEHVPRPWLVVAECAKVVVPGGIAFSRHLGCIRSILTHWIVGV